MALWLLNWTFWGSKGFLTLSLELFCNEELCTFCITFTPSLPLFLPFFPETLRDKLEVFALDLTLILLDFREVTLSESHFDISFSNKPSKWPDISFFLFFHCHYSTCLKHRTRLVSSDFASLLSHTQPPAAWLCVEKNIIAQISLTGTRWKSGTRDVSGGRFWCYWKYFLDLIMSAWKYKFVIARDAACWHLFAWGDK